jgi:hypothetical protein
MTKAELRAMHSSVSKSCGVRIKPRNMARATLPSDSRQALEELVFGIFADMSNAGATLHQTLSAIYLTGMEHAEAIRRVP